MGISIADYLILSKNVNSSSAIQLVLHLYGNQRIYHYVHKSPQLDPILTQNNRVQAFTLYFSDNQFDAVDLRIGLWSRTSIQFSQRNNC
jgi:hypothetical protein